MGGVFGYKPLYSPDEIRDLARGFSVNHILKNNAHQNKPLDFRTAYILGVFTLYPHKEYLKGLFEVERELAERQSIATLCALHNRETYLGIRSPDQIAGICAAIFDYDISMSQFSFLETDLDYSMDICGMGGDLYRTPNVSTISALIAAADGIPLCKHGSPGNTDSTGSSDFLEFCGVNLFPDKEIVEEALTKFSFGYTDALDTRYKSIHVQTHKSAHLAHMNDIMGPITNPLHPKLMKRRVLGVNHLIEPRVVAEAYQILNEKGITYLEHGLFVRGFVDENRNGGIDEVSIFEGGTKVAELRRGRIEVYDLYAKDFGIGTQPYFEPPKGKLGKAKFSKEILEGKVEGAAMDLILANTAVLEYLARDISLEGGFERAKGVLKSAAAIRNLEGYIQFTGGIQDA